MIFIIEFKTPGGRTCKLNCIAPDFDTCLKKISNLYGKNLLRITYDLRKNSADKLEVQNDSLCKI